MYESKFQFVSISSPLNNYQQSFSKRLFPPRGPVSAESCRYQKCSSNKLSSVLIFISSRRIDVTYIYILKERPTYLPISTLSTCVSQLDKNLEILIGSIIDCVLSVSESSQASSTQFGPVLLNLKQVKPCFQTTSREGNFSELILT